MFLLKTEHSYAIARFLLSVPVQAHAVLAVGGFQGDGVDLPAVVHRDPHRTAQTAVLGHYVGFPSPAFAGQNLAGEGDRAAAALGAERRQHLAAAIDLDAHFAQPHFAGVVHRSSALPLAAEAHGIIPTEPGSARGPVEIVIEAPGRAVVAAAGAAVIAASDRPAQAEV